MAVYAIGDVQGCYDELRQLLDLIHFDVDQDQLWFVGDLVNRGPKSLEVLRFVKGLGQRAISVLGNHDMHLLALAAGNPKHKDEASLDPVLHAKDRDELLDWLQNRPFLHYDKKLDFAMLHAGLPPQWDFATAQSCAHELEQVLQGEGKIPTNDYFANMYGNKPEKWSKDLKSMDRLRFITNCFTRVRFVAEDGSLALKEKLAPGTQAKGLIPWFDHPKRKSANTRIVFGHWSTLGLHQSNQVWATDTGCLWGGELTALRLDGKKPQAIQLPCSAQRNPGAFV